MDLVKVVESENLRNSYPEVEIGDYVKAYLKLDEQEPYYWSLIRAAWASRDKAAA